MTTIEGNFNPEGDRWPPVYDAEDLAATIKDLANHNANLWHYNPTCGPDFPCQGDIVSLEVGIPVINQDGAAATQGNFQSWLVVGNTCDIARENSEVPWTQVAPLQPFSPSNMREELFAAHQNYKLSRQFYVPSSACPDGAHHFLAEFTRSTTIHKDALYNCERLGRVTFHGWLLLHSCLVRFLGRDDGRFD